MNEFIVDNEARELQALVADLPSAPKEGDEVSLIDVLRRLTQKPESDFQDGLDNIERGED